MNDKVDKDIKIKHAHKLLIKHREKKQFQTLVEKINQLEVQNKQYAEKIESLYIERDSIIRESQILKHKVEQQESSVQLQLGQVEQLEAELKRTTLELETRQKETQLQQEYTKDISSKLNNEFHQLQVQRDQLKLKEENIDQKIKHNEQLLERLAESDGSSTVLDQLKQELEQKQLFLESYEQKIDDLKTQIEESFKQKASEADKKIEEKITQCKQTQLKNAKIKKQLAEREQQLIAREALVDTIEKVGEIIKHELQSQLATVHEKLNNLFCTKDIYTRTDNAKPNPTDNVTSAPSTPKNKTSNGVSESSLTKSPEHFTSALAVLAGQSPKRQMFAKDTLNDNEALLEMIKQRARSKVSRIHHGKSYNV